jgi:hypothetical protein
MEKKKNQLSIMNDQLLKGFLKDSKSLYSSHSLCFSLCIISHPSIESSFQSDHSV